MIMNLLKKIVSWCLIHKNRIIIGGIIVIGSSLIGYLLFHSQPVKYTYITQPVQKGTLINDVTGTGNLEYAQSSVVNSQVSGYVTSIDVHEGQIVTAGEKLYQVQNSNLTTQADKYYAAYLQDKQVVSNDQTTIIQDQNNLNNLNTTVTADQQPTATPLQQQALSTTEQQQTVARQQLNTAQLALVAAQANENADWETYVNQLSTINQMNVTAPISGMITNINISPGQYLSGSAGGAAAANNPQMLIVNPKSLVADITLNEVDVVKVRSGQNVQLTFNAINSLNLTGTVTSINPIGTISQGVVTYSIVVTPSLFNSQLKSGMSVTATITTEVKNNVIYIPSSAIKSNSSGQYVQILRNNRPVNLTVQTGLVTNNGTEITKGLQVGEKIITQTISNQLPKSLNTSQVNGLLKLNGGGKASGLFGGGKAGKSKL